MEGFALSNDWLKTQMLLPFLRLGIFLSSKKSAIKSPVLFSSLLKEGLSINETNRASASSKSDWISGWELLILILKWTD
jgi:hypothetical protein